MPAPQPATPIRFSDFSPGIADLPGMGYKPETATRDNTWRCIANHSGALVPLPYRHEPFTLPHHPGTWGPAVVGVYVPPIPLLPKDPSVSFDTSNYPEHQVFVGVEWVTGTPPGTSYINHELYRYRQFSAAGGYDLLKSTTNSFAPATNFGPNPYRPTGMNFATTRSNRADYSKPGVPVTILQGYGYLSEFPDDQNPTSVTPFDIATGFYPAAGSRLILNMCTHQGRVVLEQILPQDHGPNTITFTGENVTWSFFNDVTPARWGTWNGGDPTIPANFDTTAKVFVPENSSGFGCMVSMSANELFFVKTAHGAGYVTGSLDTGQVVSLPMVAGADISQIPAVSSIGVVYGNRTSGIWVWTHGDNAVNISTQLAPNFWTVGYSNDPTSATFDMDDFGGVGYSFATCDDWILTPNNWIYDTAVKSWWRLEDPAVMVNRWVTSQWHYIYTAESYYGIAPALPSGYYDTPVHFYKREWKTPTFSWQSHPIWQSVEDLVHVNDIGLVAEGNGEITLTLTALNGDTNAITITLDDCGFPERFRERLSIQGKYLQLRIESASPNAYVPAPTVYSVTLYPFSEAPIGHTQ